MLIRRTSIESRETGEPDYTYRLVESVRTGSAVRQHTVLNLGRSFEVPRARWGPLAQRVEALVHGQLDLVADGLDPAREALAEQYAARLVWLRERGYRYLVVSRECNQQFGPGQAATLRAEGAARIRVQRLLDDSDGEVRLYRHSSARDGKERAVVERFSTRQEAVLRSLKSELGLSPVYHQKSGRADGHLFISLLAHQLVHTLRLQLKAQGIHLSWESLRDQFDGQERLTIVLHGDDGQIDHIRKATRREPHQQILHKALGIPHLRGKTEKTVIDPSAKAPNCRRQRSRLRTVTP